MVSLYQAERQVIERWDKIRLSCACEYYILEMDRAVEVLRDLHYPEEPTNE